ncbi:MAG: hypothetical protein AUH43_22100 [Acidobacteria bacterium 13_1_40CM_65_14]|nr:MAG: hypothetical protein AUH43_22100 [Acidobacteria bacterium 13_1_40CM_65_14]
MRFVMPMVVVLALAGIGDPVGSTIRVPSGGDLQAALNNARPGDTILLARDGSYLGSFVLPARRGDDDRVITVRTEGDADLPREGERMTPSAAEHLAKLRSPNGSPALQTAPGARGWRIALVEIQATRDGAGTIVALGDASSAQHSLERVPSHLALDRLYIHGDPERGQRRGIALNSSSTAITGCYISDIKAIGVDSQAIAGWNGPGDYTIQNNYLEAAGENIMFGGGDPAIPDLVPTKIVVRDNLLSKPLAWREPGAPKWQIKNLFELKNARGVIVEHNVMERSWQQAQTGYAVLFTVRNQDGGCPWCQVEEVQFRGNLVRDMAAGIQLLGSDPNHSSRQTNRIVIRDNVFDGIDKAAWGGDGYFLLLSDAPRDITVDHNTIVQRASGGLVKIAHGVTSGFTMTNNIASHGEYGIIGRDRGIGNDSIAAYLPGATITRNVIAGGKASAYPSGNLFPSVDDVRKQLAGYRLVASSPWRRAGTDGRDLGANPDLVPHPGATAPSTLLR